MIHPGKSSKGKKEIIMGCDCDKKANVSMVIDTSKHTIKTDEKKDTKTSTPIYKKGE